MFHNIYVAVATLQYEMESMKARQKLDEEFWSSIKDLPIEEQLSRINSWESAKEKARLEAIEERRHQELCRAIRESGRPLWPLYFGGL